MRRCGALALVAIVACDTGSAATTPNENATAESASRLRAQTWSVPDANPAESVELFRYFYDTERKEGCAFVDDGVAHVGPGPTYWCLPIDHAQHDATGGLAIFADAACRVPLALAPPTGSAKYVIRRPANACTAPPAVYLAEPAQTVRPYVFDGFRCAPGTGTVTAQALGDEVPLASFVSATESITVASGPIAGLELKASDGTRQPIGGFDRARGIAVDARDQGGGGARWFPSRLAFEGAGTTLFRSDQCEASSSVPVKIARDAICPLGASFAFEGTCGDGQFYALVGALDVATLHEKNALKVCIPAKEPGLVAYERGAPIPRDAFTAASIAEKGHGRIRLHGWSDGTTTPVWNQLFDTQTGTACSIVTFPDGTSYCLPSASAAVTLFADDACKIPAFEEILECPERAPPPAPTWVSDTRGRAFHVTGPVATLYEAGASGCKPHAPPAPSRGFAVEPADLGTFARAVEHTD